MQLNREKICIALAFVVLIFIFKGSVLASGNEEVSAIENELTEEDRYR